MLDVISGGRLVAGFPVGTPMDTNFCYGQIPALTRDKYYEAHELIMRAWKEDEPFAFDGKYTQLRYVNCWPKPIQKPHPPIYIPGGGSVETWDFCADFDYNYSYLSFTGYVRGKQFLDGFWERVAAKGKDPSPYRARSRRSSALPTAIARPRSSTPSTFATSSTAAAVYPGFADPPGYRTIKTLKVGALAQLTEDALAKFPTLAWKQLIDDRYVIAGSPETVRQQMEEMIQGLHIGHVFCLFHNGNMPDWRPGTPQALRRAGDAESSATSGRSGGTTSAGGRSRCGSARVRAVAPRAEARS